MNRVPSIRSASLWIVMLGGALATERSALAQGAAPPTPPTPPPAAPPPAAAPVAPAAEPAPAAAAPAAAAPAAAPPAEVDPDTLGPVQTKPVPFAYGDFTWLNGYDRRHKALLDTPMISPIILVDTNYTYSFNRPIDDTVVGSTSLFRNNEIALLDVGLGAEVHFSHMRAKVLTQFGGRSTVIPRNDFSNLKGQYNLANAYRYLSEAYAGYHWDVLNGVNVDAGIFMSYIGLFSYFSAENWMYQPSFTSDNTPWFFNGIRTQIFLSDKFKIEPWIINGWQSYAKFNEMPGLGVSFLWMPVESFKLVSNNYYGWDSQYNPGRLRAHTDNSILVRWFNDPSSTGVSKAAFSLTGDAGFETGDGVTPFNGKGTEGHCTNDTPCNQNFLSWMLYQRFWFMQDHIGVAAGGGMMHNDGRYLVLSPTGIAGQNFDFNSGTKFNGADFSVGAQWMPNDYFEFLVEFLHRQTDVPYYAGHGGVTGPTGYNGGTVDNPAPGAPPGWQADSVKSENRIILAWLARL